MGGNPMKRTLLLVAGVVFSTINMLPMPWRLRVLWMRFLYFLTSRGTSWFPGILSWIQHQNIAYRMGKQAGEDYESFVQLEVILKQLEALEIPPQHVKQALAQAEAGGIPFESYGAYIAQAVLEPPLASRVLEESLQATRY
jgi:hypothetical protein